MLAMAIFYWRFRIDTARPLTLQLSAPRGQPLAL